MDWALAVDYGTILTCAAVGTGDRVEILEIGFDRCLPSPVGMDDEGQFVTGREALALARWDAARVEEAPKRALVAGAAVRLGDRVVDPIDLVAATLRRVADEAQRRFGDTPPSRVVLTHPVRCSPVETDRLLAAATRAGLSGLELLPEPLAVAAFHGVAVPVGGHVAVYGLGSDSFGASVLRRTPTSFELCGDGHRGFGGDAVDEALFDLVAGHARGADPDAWDRIWTGPGGRGQAMRERLLEAKAELSSRPWVAVAVDGIDSGVRITRRELERAVEDRLVATADELVRTVRDAGVDPTALDGVYLSGAASRMPRIAELIRERTGLTPDVHDDPKAAVALGALVRVPAREAPQLVAAGVAAGSPAAAPVDARPEAPVDPDPGPAAAPVVDPPPAPPVAAPAPDPEPPSRRSHRLWPVLVGVGMAALVAAVVTPIALHSRSATATPAALAPPLAVVATTAARPTTSASASASAPTASVEASARTTATSSATPGRRAEPDLDARHLALFRSLADVGGVRWLRCIAYPDAESAVYVTAIQCSPSDPSLARNVVFYRLADDAAYAAMNADAASNVTGAGASTGNCADGEPSATTWSKGFLVCYVDPDTGSFRMTWAASGSLTGAMISDPNPATAYAWWEAHNTTLP